LVSADVATLGSIFAPQLHTARLYMHSEHPMECAVLLDNLNTKKLKSLSLDVNTFTGHANGTRRVFEALTRLLPTLETLMLAFEDLDTSYLDLAAEHCRQLRHLRLTFLQQSLSAETLKSVREIVLQNIDTIECLDVKTQGSAAALFPDQELLLCNDFEKIKSACLAAYGLPLAKLNIWREPDFMGSFGYIIREETSPDMTKQLYDYYYERLLGCWTASRATALHSIIVSKSHKIMGNWLPWLESELKLLLDATITTPGLLLHATQPALGLLDTVQSSLKVDSTSKFRIGQRDHLVQVIRTWISQSPAYILPEVLAKLRARPNIESEAVVQLFSDQKWMASIGFHLGRPVTLAGVTQPGIFFLFVPRVLPKLMEMHNVDPLVRDGNGKLLVEILWQQPWVLQVTPEYFVDLVKYSTQNGSFPPELKECLRALFEDALRQYTTYTFMSFFELLGREEALETLVNYYRAKTNLPLKHVLEDTTRILFAAKRSVEADILTMLWEDAIRTVEIADLETVAASFPRSFVYPNWLVDFVHKNAEAPFPSKADTQTLRVALAKFIPNRNGFGFF
jgi:hypothetical protein